MHFIIFIIAYYARGDQIWQGSGPFPAVRKLHPQAVADRPLLEALFAAFLGYNPMQQLLPHAVLANLPAAARNLILGKEFFPSLMAPAFMASLRITFYGAAAMSLVAAIASLMRGEKYIHEVEEEE
jgi:hypothetical protein